MYLLAPTARVKPAEESLIKKSIEDSKARGFRTSKNLLLNSFKQSMTPD